MARSKSDAGRISPPPPSVGEGRGGGRMARRRDFARDLRTNMTEAESQLWPHLRKRRLHECKFRRQVVIGDYIIDFACMDRKLIVELDGSQHTLQREYDEERTRWLESQGYRVLRFWNFEVMEDVEAVLERIWNSLDLLEAPPPRPSPTRGEGKRFDERERTAI